MSQLLDLTNDFKLRINKLLWDTGQVYTSQNQVTCITSGYSGIKWSLPTENVYCAVLSLRNLSIYLSSYFYKLFCGIKGFY